MPGIPPNLYAIGRDGNLGTADPLFRHWTNLGNFGGWTLRSLAQGPDTRIYGVGTQGNVGLWDGRGWTTPAMAGWAVKSLAWGPDGALWCVGMDGNVGLWRDYGWQDQGNLGGWTLKMLAFDPQGTMYGVGTDGNVGLWADKWCDAGLGGWTLEMLAFERNGLAWCVGTGGNLGCWMGKAWLDQGKPGGWDLAWIHVPLPEQG